MKKYFPIFIIVILLLIISSSGCQRYIDLKERDWPSRWSIGIYVGDSSFNFYSPENISNPVLTAENITDVPASFIADPFMIKEDSVWYMFFEIMNNITNSEDIALATSIDGFEWTYQQIVLDEIYPLSYPYVFKWMDDFYMIPSSAKSGGIQLYQAVDFPFEWSCLGILIDGLYFDASIFRYENHWWIFACSNTRENYDLNLFYADNLMGPWKKHPESPIIDGNSNIARPSGRVLVLDNNIIRYTQDCYPEYCCYF